MCYNKIVLCVTISLLVVGCNALRGSNGGPDEFSVVTRAPLSLPPDFGIRPPRVGAERPYETRPRDDARKRLLENSDNRFNRNLGSRKPSKNRFTNGETSLLKRADALNVDPKIRAIIERESGRLTEDDSLVERLVFWRKKLPPRAIVEPNKEAERLRDNSALGNPPTTGTTPIIEKR